MQEIYDVRRRIKIPPPLCWTGITYYDMISALRKLKDVSLGLHLATIGDPLEKLVSDVDGSLTVKLGLQTNSNSPTDVKIVTGRKLSNDIISKDGRYWRLGVASTEWRPDSLSSARTRGYHDIRDIVYAYKKHIESALRQI